MCAGVATGTSGGLLPNAARETAARTRRVGLSAKNESNEYAKRHGGVTLLPLQHQLTFYVSGGPVFHCLTKMNQGFVRNFIHNLNWGIDTHQISAGEILNSF